jgi:tetratricopeptide (TPR) repeat protein
MPLGLELAAAWLPTLSPGEIAQEIQRDLSFLAAPTRDIPERHRSLRAVFEHSWQMLSSEAQQALIRMSVFQDGFRRAGAEAVGLATLPLLSELVDKSMLRRAPGGRYEIQELIRQNVYARLKRQAAEYQATRSQHAGYYMGLLKSWEVQLRGEQQKEALEEISREMGNIRLAWEWVMERQDLRSLRIGIVALLAYHEQRSLWAEGEYLFRQALAFIRNLPPEAGPDRLTFEILLGDVLARLAWFSFRLGRLDEALDLLLESLDLLRKNQVLDGLFQTYPQASQTAAAGEMIRQFCAQPFGPAAREIAQGLLVFLGGEAAGAQFLRSLDESVEATPVDLKEF